MHLTLEPLEGRDCPSTVYFHDSLAANQDQTQADLHAALVQAMTALAQVAPVDFVELAPGVDAPTGAVVIDYVTGHVPALATTTNPGSAHPVITLDPREVFPVASVYERAFLHETALAVSGLPETPPGVVSILSGQFDLVPSTPTAADVAALDAVLGSGTGGVSEIPQQVHPWGLGSVDPLTETWYLRNSLTPGAPTIAPFRYGAPGWTPVVGDWNGDGQAGIGAFDPATGIWYLRNEDGPGAPDAGTFAFGAPGWLPKVTPEGHVGVVDPASGVWYQAVPGGVTESWAPDTYRIPALLGTVDAASGEWALTLAQAQQTPFAYGAPGWLPLAGRWRS